MLWLDSRRSAGKVLAVLFGLTALLLSPSALALCKGGMADGKCTPEMGVEDCACTDCQAACVGECNTADPACTLEDACTCQDCWMDVACYPPSGKNCVNNSDCDFFTEGCCCDDCKGLAVCAAFNGTCGASGAGGAGGTGGTGGTGGAGVGGTSGSAGSAGSAGSGGLHLPKAGGCGCTSAGDGGEGEGLPAGLFAVALGLASALRARGAALGARSRDKSRARPVAS